MEFCLCPDSFRQPANILHSVLDLYVIMANKYCYCCCCSDFVLPFYAQHSSMKRVMCRFCVSKKQTATINILLVFIAREHIDARH